MATILNTNITPSPRTITFTISSSPIGASVYIDNVNTGYITPYQLVYSESELLTPKTVKLINGSSNSVETYILSSEVVTTKTNGDVIVDNRTKQNIK